MYMRVFPITEIVIETGSFDTMVLKAYEKGELLPEGEDYQHGYKYGFDTQREAVFYRDKYKCIICGKSPMENSGTILRLHHRGFWKDDRSNRIENLATVCIKCHTHKNHKKGGVLYGLELRTTNLSGAAFMNAVRWEIMKRIKELDCVKKDKAEVSS